MDTELTTEVVGFYPPAAEWSASEPRSSRRRASGGATVAATSTASSSGLPMSGRRPLQLEMLQAQAENIHRQLQQTGIRRSTGTSVTAKQPAAPQEAPTLSYSLQGYPSIDLPRSSAGTHFSNKSLELDYDQLDLGEALHLSNVIRSGQISSEPPTAAIDVSTAHTAIPTGTARETQQSAYSGSTMHAAQVSVYPAALSARDLVPPAYPTSSARESQQAASLPPSIPPAGSTIPAPAAGPAISAPVQRLSQLSKSRQFGSQSEWREKMSAGLSELSHMFKTKNLRGSSSFTSGMATADSAGVNPAVSAAAGPALNNTAMHISNGAAGISHGGAGISHGAAAQPSVSATSNASDSTTAFYSPENDPNNAKSQATSPWVELPEPVTSPTTSVTNQEVESRWDRTVSNRGAAGVPGTGPVTNGMAATRAIVWEEPELGATAVGATSSGSAGGGFTSSGSAGVGVTSSGASSGGGVASVGQVGGHGREVQGGMRESNMLQAAKMMRRSWMLNQNQEPQGAGAGGAGTAVGAGAGAAEGAGAGASAGAAGLPEWARRQGAAEVLLGAEGKEQAGGGSGMAGDSAAARSNQQTTAVDTVLNVGANTDAGLGANLGASLGSNLRASFGAMPGASLGSNLGASSGANEVMGASTGGHGASPALDPIPDLGQSSVALPNPSQGFALSRSSVDTLELTDQAQVQQRRAAARAETARLVAETAKLFQGRGKSVAGVPDGGKLQDASTMTVGAENFRSSSGTRALQGLSAGAARDTARAPLPGLAASAAATTGAAMGATAAVQVAAAMTAVQVAAAMTAVPAATSVPMAAAMTAVPATTAIPAAATAAVPAAVRAGVPAAAATTAVQVAAAPAAASTKAGNAAAMPAAATDAPAMWKAQPATDGAFTDSGFAATAAAAAAVAGRGHERTFSGSTVASFSLDDADNSDLEDEEDHHAGTAAAIGHAGSNVQIASGRMDAPAEVDTHAEAGARAEAGTRAQVGTRADLCADTDSDMIDLDVDMMDADVEAMDTDDLPQHPASPSAGVKQSLPISPIVVPAGVATLPASVGITTRSSLTAGMTTGVSAGVTTGISMGTSTGMATGMTTGMTGGMTTGVTTGMPTDMTTGITTRSISDAGGVVKASGTFGDASVPTALRPPSGGSSLPIAGSITAADGVFTSSKLFTVQSNRPSLSSTPLMLSPARSTSSEETSSVAPTRVKPPSHSLRASLAEAIAMETGKDITRRQSSATSDTVSRPSSGDGSSPAAMITSPAASSRIPSSPRTEAASGSIPFLTAPLAAAALSGLRDVSVSPSRARKAKQAPMLRSSWTEGMSRRPMSASAANLPRRSLATQLSEHDAVRGEIPRVRARKVWGEATTSSLSLLPSPPATPIPEQRASLAQFSLTPRTGEGLTSGRTSAPPSRSETPSRLETLFSSEFSRPPSLTEKSTISRRSSMTDGTNGTVSRTVSLTNGTTASGRAPFLRRTTSDSSSEQDKLKRSSGTTHPGANSNSHSGANSASHPGPNYTSATAATAATLASIRGVSAQAKKLTSSSATATVAGTGAKVNANKANQKSATAKLQRSLSLGSKSLTAAVAEARNAQSLRSASMTAGPGSTLTGGLSLRNSLQSSSLSNLSNSAALKVAPVGTSNASSGANGTMKKNGSANQRGISSTVVDKQAQATITLGPGGRGAPSVEMHVREIPVMSTSAGSSVARLRAGNKQVVVSKKDAAAGTDKSSTTSRAPAEVLLSPQSAKNLASRSTAQRAGSTTATTPSKADKEPEAQKRRAAPRGKVVSSTEPTTPSFLREKSFTGTIPATKCPASPAPSSKRSASPAPSLKRCPSPAPSTKRAVSPAASISSRMSESSNFGRERESGVMDCMWLMLYDGMTIISRSPPLLSAKTRFRTAATKPPAPANIFAKWLGTSLLPLIPEKERAMELMATEVPEVYRSKTGKKLANVELILNHLQECWFGLKPIPNTTTARLSLSLRASFQPPTSTCPASIRVVKNGKDCTADLSTSWLADYTVPGLMLMSCGQLQPPTAAEVLGNAKLLCAWTTD